MLYPARGNAAARECGESAKRDVVRGFGVETEQ
jgi:hypothetical protein